MPFLKSRLATLSTSIALGLLLAIAAIAAPQAAPPASPAPAVETPALSIRVQGHRFIDARGNPIRLRGVNVSGFEFVAIQGWSASDPSGAQAGQAQGPKWPAIAAWRANVVRFPLNEASWLGYTCTDSRGVRRNPDPGGNYRAAVREQVAQATAAGLYAIIDLHWTAPGRTCPMLQTQMANRDNSLAFWTSVAKTFKHNPAVMFELFNEPFMNFGFSGDAWRYLMHGTDGRFTGYPATSIDGHWREIEQPWEIASYQSLLNAVRATGARNVVLVGTMQYAQDFSGWLAHRPRDPLQQMAAVWHPYATFGKKWGSRAYAQPNYAPEVFADVLKIQAAGFPVLATETGDRNTVGTVGAPLVSTITRWAARHEVGVLGWGWNVWKEPEHVLIRDVNGTPTDGYGQVFHAWMTAH